jgi:hypothetical protein
MADQKTLANTMGVAMNLLFQDKINAIQKPSNNLMPSMPPVPAPKTNTNSLSTAVNQAQAQVNSANSEVSPQAAQTSAVLATAFPPAGTGAVGNNSSAVNLLKAKI